MEEEKEQEEGETQLFKVSPVSSALKISWERSKSTMSEREVLTYSLAGWPGKSVLATSTS